MNLAIVIGVEKYKFDTFDNLPACANDAKAMRDILENVKDFKEILYINENEPSYEIKNKISEFIEKYRNAETKTDEVLFYFSGHGERIEDDFFYVLYDFEQTKKESTGLRNTELDNLIKGLAPQLFVKIVDACFSGTQYIKSESVLEAEVKKSANKSGFKDIYFLFSSRENEVSHAGKEFSKFTESILLALTERTGNIRYADIISFVADDLSKIGAPKPMFITQCNSTEKFGNISEETHAIINKYFDSSVEKKIKNQDNNFDTTNENKEYTIAERIIEHSNKICFDENKLVDFIKGFFMNFEEEWNPNIANVYEIKIHKYSETYLVPNETRVGNWLADNKKENFFAEPRYKQVTYKAQEYTKIPKKPNNKMQAFIISNNLYKDIYKDDDFDYKLETIEKTENIIDGFSYTHSVDSLKLIYQIVFQPKIELVSSLSLCIVPIYSNKKFIIHYSYEILSRTKWNNYANPKCQDWRVLDVNINKPSSEKLASEHIKNEFSQWVESYYKELLNK